MQYTEDDQPLYEESLAHLSLNSHPCAKKVSLQNFYKDIVKWVNYASFHCL